LRQTFQHLLRKPGEHAVGADQIHPILVLSAHEPLRELAVLISSALAGDPSFTPKGVSCSVSLIVLSFLAERSLSLSGQHDRPFK
jgi:hypothetical protein